MEVYNRLSDETRSDIFTLLKGFGYTILNIGAFGDEIVIKPGTIDSVEKMPAAGETENIVAYREL
jgi:hypothetical protein